jgi:hypothetical protein
MPTFSCFKGNASLIARTHIAVESLLIDEVLVGSVINNRTILQNVDMIDIDDSVQTVSNNESGSSDHQSRESLHNLGLRDGVQSGSNFIKEQNLGLYNR